MERRAVSPLVGTILMIGLTVVFAGLIGAMVVGSPVEDEPTTARFSASANATNDSLSVTHEGGDALDPDSLSLRVRIEGTALEYQPPIPFFSAHGFDGGPTGPFNDATGGDWTAGETGSLGIASTNAPLLSSGDTVELTLSLDDEILAELETTAR